MKIAIKKDAPVALSERKRRTIKYPWHELKPGQSFFVPLGGRYIVIERLQSALSSIANSIFGPGAYATRVINENEIKGVRVWRIK
jgi:hypothetical protein